MTSVSVFTSTTGVEKRAGAGGPVRLQILGPLRVWRGDTEVEAGPRQQAYLLALLLSRAGRPVSTGDLIELIWAQDAPASAVNVIHKYVGSLRHILEPGLPAREAGSHLLRRGTGYQLEAGPAMLDLAAFRHHVNRARDRSGAEALEHHLTALGLWRGPAGDGLAGGTAAMSIFAGIDGEFFDACVKAADLAVALGRADRVLGPLQLAATMAPLHEPVQTSLVAALGAAGRPAQALSVYATVRGRLAEELGVEPGAALQRAYRQVLNRSVTHRPQPAPVMTGPVGRARELAVLDGAVRDGRGLVVVQGEPGVGKTSVLEEAAERAGRAGALVVWGHCLEGEGTPSMWPWTQVTAALVESLPAAERERWRQLVTPAGECARFRLFEQVVALIGRVSADRPVMLVLDDLHWADAGSLELFSHVAAAAPAGTVIVGALRDRAPEPAPALSRLLAAAARHPGHRRIRLGPLGPADVAELVRRETGRDLGPGVGRRIHARTAGNPFLARELSRLLADEGVLTADAAARVGVPPTVRDVVRGRMADLDDGARHLLQTAALMGGDGEIGRLARAAGVDAGVCLARLAALEALALIERVPDDPYAFRFRHDLIRESIAASAPLRQLTRLAVQ
ncbi:BTAD domain-containing putative transcriptional regulator [Actinoplanes sp. NPDC049596]|uniref:BTAD domain-containing putative transcriptional regulator n=1 Tax=unclassified Actinoplanes TaxID=2626549 RepID=UPI003412DFAD